MTGFIEHLKFVATINYNVAANSRCLRFSRANPKFLILLGIHLPLLGNESKQCPLLLTSLTGGGYLTCASWLQLTPSRAWLLLATNHYPWLALTSYSSVSPVH
jgi:hypothetical protein